MSQFGVQPSRLGQVNGAGDADALFLKVFSGEIISVFEEANLMLPLTKTRNISSGKTATFPVVGVASAKYHTPGESVMQQNVTNTISGDQGSEALAQSAANKYLSTVKHAERTISIDDMLVSTAFIADIDEAKNHWDVRSAYTSQIGRELAYHTDRALMRTVIAGARGDKDRFGGTDNQFLGESIDGASGAAYTVAELITTIASIAQKMDEKNVPAEGRYCVLTPANYYTIVSSGNAAINSDFGGMGSIATGEVAQLSGIRLLKSNHLPSGTDAGTSIFKDSGIKNDVYDTHDGTGSVGAGYSATAAYNTAGVAFQSEAVGTVKLLDLGVESEYQMDRLGTLMLAKYAMGHGILREECCYELVTA
tara:strand:- start:2699 stop:3793 length:1095 start_codon:yes stop_codon:yes gene_type:complete